MTISGATKFTLIGIAFNAAIAFVAAKWPEWLSGMLLSKDGSFTHLASKKYFLDLVLLSSLIIFVVQIVFLARLANITMAKAAFQVANDAFGLKIIRSLALLIATAIFALSVGYAAKSLVGYGYALAKEFLYADTRNWNWRVAQGNEDLAKGDLEKAIGQFQGAVDGPGRTLDSYNVQLMRERIQRLRHAATLSDTLLARGDRLAATGQLHVSIEFYRQALSTFQFNAPARSRIAALRARFEGERTLAREFYELCNQRRLDQIMARSGQFSFFIRNSASLARNEERLTLDQQTRALTAVCLQARQFPSFEAYHADVEKRIFDPNALQELI
jgi:tetratricopeptide (TPR) repeat protein